ncbi:DUF6578 domain-containing protein [Kocuria turfanensis]|uniref:DUF6578 domain-containing protein n=1 Tax=Kocuria turfanensis TaxID=388357 RepID=UPI004037031A
MFDSMVIEVDLSEWEQQCCGDPFRVGSTVTWKLVARAPSQDAGAVSRYREEHHGETPEHVPHLPVIGTVRAILGLHCAFDEGPNAGELAVRPGSEVGVELEAVRRRHPAAGILGRAPAADLPGAAGGRRRHRAAGLRSWGAGLGVGPARSEAPGRRPVRSAVCRARRSVRQLRATALRAAVGPGAPCAGGTRGRWLGTVARRAR